MSKRPIEPSAPPISLRVVEGDCLVEMRKLPTASFDVVLADPPYSSGATREAGKVRDAGDRMSIVKGREWFPTDSLTTEGLRHFMRDCALEWRRLVRPGGHVLVFIDWRMTGTVGQTVARAIETADLHWKNEVAWDRLVANEFEYEEILWEKLHNAMGWHFRTRHEKVLHFSVGTGSGRKASRHDVGNVIPCRAIHPKKRRHPTEKPVPLLRTLLSVVGRPGDAVLDPFCGSGATGEACAAEGMSFVGIESTHAAEARARCAEAAARLAMRMPFPDRAL